MISVEERRVYLIINIGFLTISSHEVQQPCLYKCDSAVLALAMKHSYQFTKAIPTPAFKQYLPRMEYHKHHINKNSRQNMRQTHKTNIP